MASRITINWQARMTASASRCRECPGGADAPRSVRSLLGEVMTPVEDGEDEEETEDNDEEDMEDLEVLERVFSDMAPPWECMENCWETQTEISSGFRDNNTETLSG
ncbi:hypothetical protein ABH940_000573 [Streptacidiphilus sp. BW17]|uniref:hypothetical protein n=1 Tax=Streptacidiphilus sp. BW17 TaxID=3156274 RepID=UPI0035131FF6